MRLKVSNVCQLLDKDNLNSFVVGNLDKITVTDNKDGTFIINGSYSNTYNSWYILNEWNVEKGNISQIVEGHKYLLLGDVEKVSGDIHLGINIWYVDGSSQSNYSGIIISLKTTKLKTVRVQYSFYEGATADNAISKPQLFDLTEMYGAGHEPTTVAQFRQDFPNEMYEYSPVCWKKFSRLKYVTETKNLFDINKVTNYPPTYNVDNSYLKTKPLSVSSIVFLKETLIQLCPNLISGNTYVFNAKTTGKYQQILLNDIVWEFGTARTLTDADLNKTIGLYAEPTNTADEWTIISEIQIEEGSTPTPYQPYGYLPLNRGKYIANKEPVQLLDKSKYPATSTSNGITYTKNEDGSYNVNGTITTSNLSTMYVAESELKKDHWYLNNDKPDNSQKPYVECKVYIRDESKWIFPASRFKISVDRCYSRQTLLVNGAFWGAGTVISNEKLYPELFDLTEMYGAGNEPTAEEFWATHSKTTMYDYNPYNAITFR